MIEIGLEYSVSPIRFDGEVDPVVATGVHVTDRNGLFTRALVMFLFPPPSGALPSDQELISTESRVHRVYGADYAAEVTTTTETYRELSMEERLAIQAENLRARDRIQGFRGYHTELRVFDPRDGRSNTRGASFNMRLSLAASRRFSIETGFGWARINSDGCAPADLTRCRYRFLGLPVRVMVSLGRLGSLDFGYDYNLRTVGVAKPYSTGWDPFRVALTLNPFDRIFVRGAVISAPQTFLEPGFSVEVGGRL